jgi:hypothetical protein
MCVMKLVSIESTPNPNSMKLNLDESLPRGVAITYRPEGRSRYPASIQKLLEIPGLQSIYHAGDFMAFQRSPAADWEGILSQARVLLGGRGAPLAEFQARPEGEHWGEVLISVQQFRRIPMLVKVSDSQEEVRVALPGRFGIAIQQASPASPNMLLERRWVPQTPRYGTVKELGETVVAEIDAAYDQSRLDGLVRHAFEADPEAAEIRSKPAPEDFEHPDWKRRYSALEAAGDDPGFLPQLLGAMQDPQIPVRRLATVLVGLVGTPDTLPPLCAALKDPAVAVRRSAGDALNDRADPRALPAMAAALKDPNKLVRWRAARFLYELAGPEELPGLVEAQNDPEFEVRMQVRQAIERIEGGNAPQGPVWMRMTQS